MTRRLAGFLAAALGIAATTALAAPGPLEVSVERAQALLAREKLAEGIYLFRAPSDLDYWTSTNSVVILNEDDVTVFDSCTRAVTARAVIAEIRKLTSKPVRTLVNSHWHQDHWSGNNEYVRAFPGVNIVSSAETRNYMSRMGARFFVDELDQFGRDAMREALATAIRTGKLADGSPLTAEARVRKETSVAKANQFAAEIEQLPRILPNLTYQKEMTAWSGSREFRFLSLAGDASGSTVLYLPREKILVAGDVLASPEDGVGPPPWGSGTSSLAPWLDSLRRLEALDVNVIVPGQGPAMHDKVYLHRTVELFAAIVDQVHAALQRGLVKLSEVQSAVNVDRIALEYTPGVSTLNEDFHVVVAVLVKNAMQEALDGQADLK